jgi:3-phosphoshikimate 1-carboxyvinyltransferase
MALPELIEIVPLDKPVRAEITVPGSKSITNRALILAALAGGEVTLRGALWSEDTQVMVDCLQELGFMINVEPDPEEFCNRTITVYGRGGEVPRGGTEQQPLELFVGNAGTAARFLAAFVCLGSGVYRLHGVPRMHERPQAALFKALRELGYRVEAENGNEKLPVKIVGGSRSSRSDEADSKDQKNQSLLTSSATVSIEESSQFASALLLCAKAGGWDMKILGENAEESPYVRMTSELTKVFPHRGGKFQIEPDASSASYFLGANKVAPRIPDPRPLGNEMGNRLASIIIKQSGSEVHDEWGRQIGSPKRFWESMLKLAEPEDSGLATWIKHMLANNSMIGVLQWPRTQWQIDAAFPSFLGKEEEPIVEISRTEDLGDSIMTAVVIAPLNEHKRRFTDLGRLRVQECERVVALRTELTKCGAKVIEEGDTLTVYPSELHGATIETYNDHRMAMCFAILGLKVRGIKIKNPACVKKTFPNFFQKLAAAPPNGLGVTILDASGRRLTHADLFAD